MQNNSNNNNNPKIYRKVQIKSFSFKLESYNKNTREGTMSLGSGDFGYCPKTKTNTPPIEERKLTDAQILGLFNKTNDKIDKLNDKLDKHIASPFTQEQEERIGAIVAKAVEPILKEIKSIYKILEKNNIK